MRKHLASMIPNDPVGVGNAAVDPYAGYLVYDTFTDDDNTVLASHTPDKAPVGSVWVECGDVADAPKIISNKLQAAASFKEERAYINCGDADVTVEVDATRHNPNADNNQHGIVFRATDFNNHWIYRYLNTVGQAWLDEWDGGVETNKGKIAFSWADEATYTIKSILAADAIEGYIGATQTHTITDATHQTIENHGVHTYYHQGDYSTLDDFRVTA